MADLQLTGALIAISALRACAAEKQANSAQTAYAAFVIASVLRPVANLTARLE
jgi:hypothetical protein